MTTPPTTLRGRRFTKTATLVIALVALGSSTAFAGGGTTPATGVSGTQYSLTITCATRSATARASLATAIDFSGMTLSDDAGGVSPIQYTVSGAPSTTGAQNWSFAASLRSGASAYQLDEVALDGVVTPVVAAVSTTDCPTYSGVGAQFVPITPTRLLDTRAEFSIGYSGPKPGLGGFVDLQVTGRANIPADAVAVALNVTMTEASAPGFVQVYPTGIGTAGASSNINAEVTGETIPNQVIVPIGVGGKVTLFTNAGSHLLADVSGYFVDVATAVEQGRFVTVAPKRVLDTRTASPLNYSAAKPAAGTTVRLDPVTAAGLPSGQVAAIAINVTATEATAPGYVQVAPAGALVAGASSNLNIARSGQTIPNMVIVPVSAAGEIDLYTQSGTDLIVDVLGWFTNSTAPSAISGLYFPVTPERVLDTRPESAINFASERRPGLGETTKPAAAGKVELYFDGLPATRIGAVILNLTATEATAAGFVQAAAQGALVPGASSTLNLERVGQTIANASILAVSSSRAITLFTQNGTNLVADIGGFFRS